MKTFGRFLREMWGYLLFMWALFIFLGYIGLLP